MTFITVAHNDENIFVKEGFKYSYLYFREIKNLDD